MTSHRSAAEIEVLFRSFLIPHARAERTMQMVEQLREQKRKLPWGVEARAACLLAPSHSGKSQAANHMHFDRFLLPQLRQSGEYDADVSNDNIKKLQRKVIYVRIPSEYDGAFAAELLIALGDPKPWKGSVDERIRRALTIMISLGSEILILDSVDNLTRLRDSDSEKKADQTRGRMRFIIERGMPVLFIGTPSARESLFKETQLVHREQEIKFDRLTFPKDEIEYCEYLMGTDLLMVENGIFGDLSDLVAYHEQLFIGSRNRFGVTSIIIMDAAILASAKNCPRIEEQHLAEAVQTYMERTPPDPWTPDGCDINPFTRKRVTSKVSRDY